MLGGKLLDAAAWVRAFEGFVAFGLLASATYILNDLWDLPDDRQHWSKRYRPLASGELPISWGFVLVGICASIGVGIAATIGQGCATVLALYALLSLAYSFRLKREPIIDVLVLATLFTVRLAAGVVLLR